MVVVGELFVDTIFGELLEACLLELEYITYEVSTCTSTLKRGWERLSLEVDIIE